MTRSDGGRGGGQATLEEFTRPNQCTAIAEHTGERCQHPPVPGLDLCHSHADAEDLAQLADALSSNAEAT